MNNFVKNIDKVYSIVLSILTIAMDKHWILFMVLLLLNVLDTLTGWIKSSEYYGVARPLHTVK